MRPGLESRTTLNDLEQLAAHIADAAKRSRVMAEFRAATMRSSSVLVRLARAAAAALHAPVAGVMLFEDENAFFGGGHGVEGPALEYLPLCFDVLEKNAPVTTEAGVAGVPVHFPDGSVAGVLFCASPPEAPGAWTAHSLAMLEDLAGVAAAHLAHRAEHLRLEAELRDREDRYREFYRSIPIGVYSCAADGRLLMGNTALAQILGYDNFEALEREHPTGSFRLEGWDEFKRLLDERGEVRGRETRWLHRSGAVVLVRENANMVQRSDGVVYCECAAEDITEAQRVREALADSEGRFDAFMQHGPFVAFIKTPEHRLVFANSRFCELVGGSQDNPADRSRPWTEDVAAQFRENDSAVMACGHSMEFVERAPTLDGEIHQWLVQKFPFTTQAGEKLLGGVAIDITGRMRAEEALRESEERVKLAQTAAGVAYWDWKPESGECTWSPEYYRLFGLDSNLRASNRLWLGVLHPEDRERAAAEIARAVVTAGEYRAEYRVRLPDGKLRWVLALGKAFRGGDGTAVRMLGIAMDVTAAKQAEEALRASEVRFRTAAEVASDVISEWDIEAGTVHLIGPVRERLGLPSTRELPNDVASLFKVIHPEDRQRFADSLDKVVREGGKHHEEVRLMVPSGATVYMEHRGTIMRSGDSWKYIGASTDITARKRAEESMARLAALVQSSDDAILSLSLTGEILSWNRGAELMYGYHAPAMLGRSWLLLVAPERAAEFARILAQVVHGGSVNNSETVMLRRDGEEMAVSLAVSGIRTGSGELIGVSAIARDISDRKKVEQRLAYQAYHDLLTGLPNRRMLAERLQQAIARSRRRQQSLALFYIDLDGFKLVNDTLGHATGDMLLQQVARRLESCLRESDTLARSGGDEFMLVAEDISGPSSAESLAHKVMEVLMQPFSLVGRSIFVTASIGVSLYPSHAHSAAVLQQRADIAMYEAKRGGKNCMRFYTPEMTASTRERLELGTDLRQALERGELQLHYQPQYGMRTGELAGMEALLRWTHRHLGKVSPDKFIPIAEETGLILPIGEWVLREACLQIERWKQTGRSVRVAVNVSVLQFVRPEFVDTVARVLLETGADPHLLELELTESLVLDSFEDAILKMNRLRTLGVTIAMDDFGTGYSSLSYLQRLPLNAVKIDGSFTRTIGTSSSVLALIRAVAALAHDLGMRVIVEGIEQAAQLDALREIGCDEGQGYLLGHPAPPCKWFVDAGGVTCAPHVPGVDTCDSAAGVHAGS